MSDSSPEKISDSSFISESESESFADDGAPNSAGSTPRLSTKSIVLITLLGVTVVLAGVLVSSFLCCCRQACQAGQDLPDAGTPGPVQDQGILEPGYNKTKSTATESDNHNHVAQQHLQLKTPNGDSTVSGPEVADPVAVNLSEKQVLSPWVLSPAQNKKLSINGTYRTSCSFNFTEDKNSVERVAIFSSDLKNPSEAKIGTFTFKPIKDLGGCSLNLLGPTGYTLKKIGDNAVIKALTTCVGITNSEIIAEIQKKKNENAYFVLPSQLNGAEYPGQNRIVQKIDQYYTDNTGGPRGQLAVHPAAGQFVLDHASNQRRMDGINALDEITVLSDSKSLLTDKSGSRKLPLLNGYLTLPSDTTDGDVSEFERKISTVRPLVMQDVLANGLDPSKKDRKLNSTHRVTLVYASAIPVNSYQNTARGEDHRDRMLKIAELVLVGQYYGALLHASNRESLPNPHAKRLVYLMPLGGGVFHNPMETIIWAVAQAVALLTPQQRAKLDIRILSWNGCGEGATIKNHMGQFGILDDSRVVGL